MGKNSNVHIRKAYNQLDIQHEKEAEAKKLAKREKHQKKLMQQVLEPAGACGLSDTPSPSQTHAPSPSPTHAWHALPCGAAAKAAPMDVDGKKPKSKLPLRKPAGLGVAKKPGVGGIKKKSKEKGLSKIHKRQLVRAAKSKEMEL